MTHLKLTCPLALSTFFLFPRPFLRLRSLPSFAFPRKLSPAEFSFPDNFELLWSSAPWEGSFFFFAATSGLASPSFPTSRTGALFTSLWGATGCRVNSSFCFADCFEAISCKIFPLSMTIRLTMRRTMKRTMRMKWTIQELNNEEAELVCLMKNVNDAWWVESASVEWIWYLEYEIKLDVSVFFYRLKIVYKLYSPTCFGLFPFVFTSTTFFILPQYFSLIVSLSYLFFVIPSFTFLFSTFLSL